MRGDRADERVALAASLASDPVPWRVARWHKPPRRGEPDPLTHVVRGAGAWKRFRPPWQEIRRSVEIVNAGTCGLGCPAGSLSCR